MGNIVVARAFNVTPNGDQLEVGYQAKRRRMKGWDETFTVPSCVRREAPKLCIAFKQKDDEQWHRSFINEVYPDLGEAFMALPAWLTATSKYMGETVNGTYYPTRGETFEYAVVSTADAVCVDWHSVYVEELGHVVSQPMTTAEIAEKAWWQS